MPHPKDKGKGKGPRKGKGRGRGRGPRRAMTPRGVLQLDDGRLATANLVPGARVYDEDLVKVKGREFRTWNPTRSKLAAYLLKGGRHFQVASGAHVLYLGAANGTTVSHVSDVITDGRCFAVEFSARSYRDLLGVAERRRNLVPFLSDAWRPQLYSRFVGDVDLLFQDISQRRQATIFTRNLNHFRPRTGILVVKARSVDVAREPRDVWAEVAAEVEADSNYRVDEVVDLAPFEKDHAAIVVKAP